MSSSSPPPWDLWSFTFGWDSNITNTIPQCNNVTLNYEGTVNGRAINPPPTPPYNLALYSGGFEPWVISMNNSAPTGRSQWLANLPVGSTFAVSMKDSRGYSGGVLPSTLQMTSGTGCDLTSPLNVSSLSINIDGRRSQCREALLTVDNGVSPYTLEVIQLGRTQKTMRFALSPFRFILDMNAGAEYWLAVYDSQGSSGVIGPYEVGFSSDASCLGLATTMTAGRFTTLYPGGTARPTEVAGAPGSSSSASGLTANIYIVMGVLIPFLAVAFALGLLWLCFRNSNRYYPFDPHDRPRAGYPIGYFSEYRPVLGEYTVANTDPLLDRTFSSTSGTKLSSSAHSRNLVNPDSHHLGPVDVEPFDPGTIHQHTAT